MAWELTFTSPTLCSKAIFIMVLPSGTLSRTTDIENFASACQSSKHVVNLAWQKTVLSSVIYVDYRPTSELRCSTVVLQVIIKLCLQHISSVGQLAPADTCYISVSYKMTVDLGLHKNSFTAWIARRHQLNWNNNRPICVMKCCHTLLNKCQLMQIIPCHALPLTHSCCIRIGLHRCWCWVIS